MNFLEAINCTKEIGQKIRRKSWDTGAALTWKLSDDGMFFKCVWAGTPDVNYVCARTDMFANDWELVLKPMSFMEAVEHMKRGRSVRRPTWPASCSLRVDDIAFVHYTNRSYAGNRLMVGDVCANDWVLIVEPND